jgi:DNA-binding response OmpR family regulator
MNRLLMIEDDRRLAAMVGEYLGRAGFDLTHAEDIASGMALLRDRPIDLIILDLMLPDGDGLDACRRIRGEPGPLAALPILMLTAKGDPTDRVVGLEIGADDYLPKPFDPRELLARIRAVLRRRHGVVPGATLESADEVLRFGRLEIDRGARAVRIDGQEKALTSHQFGLLIALAERAGRVLTREQLMDAVRGEAGAADYDPAFDRSVDVHVARIRAAIEEDPRRPRRIITVRGAGYVFAKVQDV